MHRCLKKSSKCLIFFFFFYLIKILLYYCIDNFILKINVTFDYLFFLIRKSAIKNFGLIVSQENSHHTE